MSDRCRLGYEEHDGARYCFEHGAFLEPGVRTQRCADADRGAADEYLGWHTGPDNLPEEDR